MSASLVERDRFVEVADEPNHVDQFKNEFVRVYMATIPPGTKTLMHRHVENTLYVVIEGGVNSSHEAGKQDKLVVGLPRSTPLSRKLAWATTRLLFGSMRLQKSQFFVQYHRGRPYIHRVSAAADNERPLRLLGVEILKRLAHVGDAQDMTGFFLDYADDEISVRRIRIAAQGSTGPRRVGQQSLLIIVAGRGRLSDAAGAVEISELGPGETRWFSGSETLDLMSSDNAPLDALLVTLC
jgi:hypothetical protein